MVYFVLLSVLGFLELEVTKRLLNANSSELVSPSVAITRHIRSTGLVSKSIPTTSSWHHRCFAFSNLWAALQQPRAKAEP